MGARYIKISQVVYLWLYTCNGPVPISFVDKLVINLFFENFFPPARIASKLSGLGKAT